MAHQLNFNAQNGQHRFFSVQEKPWHGLGVLLDHFPTSAEALRFAGLDYEVEKRPLFTYDNENQAADEDTEIKIPEVPVDDYYATIRTDTEQVLGIVGKDYQIIQNTDAFSFFDAIVGGDGIQYETAGALGNGERIFITAKLPSYIKVGNDDLVEQYLFLTTSHDGFGSIMAAFTPVRIVCRNTLHAALQNFSNSIKVRHTSQAKERLEQAHRLMGISHNLSKELELIFNRWSRVLIKDQHLQKLIRQALVPEKEILHQMETGEWNDLSTYFQTACNNAYEYAQIHESQQLDTTRGTLFGAFNAVTGYYQNVKQYKDNESKLKSMLLGGIAQTRTQKAFRLCEAFEKNGPGFLLLN